LSTDDIESEMTMVREATYPRTSITRRT
jgi:hypothetical protein